MPAGQNECRRLLQELLHAAALQTSNISAAFQSGAGKVTCKYAKQLHSHPDSEVPSLIVARI